MGSTMSTFFFFLSRTLILKPDERFYRLKLWVRKFYIGVPYLGWQRLRSSELSDNKSFRQKAFHQLHFGSDLI